MVLHGNFLQHSLKKTARVLTGSCEDIKQFHLLLKKWFLASKPIFLQAEISELVLHTAAERHQWRTIPRYHS